MRCPVCDDVSLVISSREGIEIDHCPQCRGVWLDRGELDKVIERAAPSVVGAARPPAEPPRGYEQPRYEQPRYEQPRHEQSRYEQPRYEQPRYDDRDYKRKKRKSFLDDLFDFD